MRLGFALLLWVAPYFVHAADLCGAIFSTQVGDKHSIRLTITQELIERTALATGDFNPMHTDLSFARAAGLKGVIPHGVLLKGLIETVITNYLPGTDAVLVQESAKYVNPAYVGDVVTASCEVEKVYDDGSLKLRTTLTNQKGEVLIDGDALVRQGAAEMPKMNLCPEEMCSLHSPGGLALPQVGEQKSLKQVITQENIDAILQLTRNSNPFHKDHAFARSFGYRTTTAPSVLVKGVLSNLLGNFFPGPGAMFSLESATYGAPVYAGDTLTALATVKRVRPKEGAMKLSVSLVNQNNEPVIAGDVLLFYKPVQQSQ